MADIIADRLISQCINPRQYAMCFFILDLILGRNAADMLAWRPDNKYTTISDFFNYAKKDQPNTLAHKPNWSNLYIWEEMELGFN